MFVVNNAVITNRTVYFYFWQLIVLI